MIYDLIKNPIVIGVLLGALTYLYIYWEESKKYEKNPKAERKPIDIITPCIVAIVGWFLSSSYFENANEVSTLPTATAAATMPSALPAAPPVPTAIGGNKPYFLLEKGNISAPDNLNAEIPDDIFIDVNFD